MLWGLNIALRDALHKLLPSFFHPHSFKLIQVSGCPVPLDMQSLQELLLKCSCG
jgi:hypothetical protein